MKLRLVNFKRRKATLEILQFFFYDCRTYSRLMSEILKDDLESDRKKPFNIPLQKKKRIFFIIWTEKYIQLFHVNCFSYLSLRILKKNCKEWYTRVDLKILSEGTINSAESPFTSNLISKLFEFRKRELELRIENKIK